MRTIAFGLAGLLTAGAAAALEIPPEHKEAVNSAGMGMAVAVDCDRRFRRPDILDAAIGNYRDALANAGVTGAASYAAEARATLATKDLPPDDPNGMTPKMMRGLCDRLATHFGLPPIRTEH